MFDVRVKAAAEAAAESSGVGLSDFLDLKIDASASPKNPFFTLRVLLHDAPCRSGVPLSGRKEAAGRAGGIVVVVVDRRRNFVVSILDAAAASCVQRRRELFLFFFFGYEGLRDGAELR